MDADETAAAGHQYFSVIRYVFHITKVGMKRTKCFVERSNVRHLREVIGFADVDEEAGFDVLG